MNSKQLRNNQKRQHCWFCRSFFILPILPIWGRGGWGAVVEDDFYIVFFFSLQMSKLSVQPSVSCIQIPVYFLNLCPSLCYSWNLKLCKLFCTLLCDGNSDFLFFVVIEVARITGAFALWDKRSFNLQHKRWQIVM